VTETITKTAVLNIFLPRKELPQVKSDFLQGTEEEEEDKVLYPVGIFQWPRNLVCVKHGFPSTLIPSSTA
jgi:hypothetical protein